MPGALVLVARTMPPEISTETPDALFFADASPAPMPVPHEPPPVAATVPPEIFTAPPCELL